MSDLDRLVTIKSQTLTRIAEITAERKPSYNIDGQQVGWTEYLKQLQETVDWCDIQIVANGGDAMALEPFEIASTGYT